MDRSNCCHVHSWRHGDALFRVRQSFGRLRPSRTAFAAVTMYGVPGFLSRRHRAVCVAALAGLLTTLIQTPHALAQSNSSPEFPYKMEIGSVYSLRPGAEPTNSIVDERDVWCGPIPQGSPVPPHARPELTVPYPTDQVKAKHQGIVQIAFNIEKDGTTTRARVIHPSAFVDLDLAAIRAAAMWHFEPVVIASQPVTFHDNRRITFSLSDESPPQVTIGPDCVARVPPAAIARNAPSISLRAVGQHRGYYPRDAIADHEEGRVLVTFTIRADGSVDDPAVETSSGFPLLDEAALESVRTWRYEPLPKPYKSSAYLVFNVPPDCEPVTLVGRIVSLVNSMPLCEEK